MTEVTKIGNEEILTSLVINGDIGKLSAAQKVTYYKMYCERLGLDPLSQPFRILKLQGKETLYCDRSGTQQLNKVHKVSHEIKSREVVSGCYVVTAQASTPEGRKTESIGAVAIENLKGEALCNAMMKAETKAKRRATLDLLGLGIMDEIEIETIPNAQVVELNAKELEAIEIWGDAISQCNNEEELLKLYNSNKEAIDSNIKVKSLFTTRKQQLRKKAQTA